MHLCRVNLNFRLSSVHNLSLKLKISQQDCILLDLTSAKRKLLESFSHLKSARVFFVGQTPSSLTDCDRLMFLNIKFISWIDLQDNMAADVCNFYNFYFCVSLFTFSSGIIWNYIVRVKLGKLILGTRSDDFVVNQN